MNQSKSSNATYSKLESQEKDNGDSTSSNEMNGREQKHNSSSNSNSMPASSSKNDIIKSFDPHDFIRQTSTRTTGRGSNKRYTFDVNVFNDNEFHAEKFVEN